VGYIFTCDDLLVSFGINKAYRTKINLDKFFNEIISKFDKEFSSYMWNRNTRAIEWLKRNGMIEVECAINNVTKLNYTICP